MKKSFNSVAFGKDFTVGSISPDLTTQLEEAASTVQHSANSLDIDGYLKNIAGFQREEIARLSIKYQALEREAKNAAEAERLQRIETARIGNLAQSLFNDASQISAASPSSSMLDLTPRGSITKSSMKEDNIAPMDRMEKLELLKRQQKELLARQADEKATLAAKQVAEHAELMKQHQSLVQKTIPSRRPASKPVRFMGLEEDGKLFDQASSGSVDVLQDPITDPMRKTAPPTTTAWSLSSDKLKKGLFKLVGMSPQPSTTNVAECLKPVDQPTNEAQPFGTVTSRRTSYAANIEMLESKAPIPPSRQPRNGPYRNISTSSAYDTYFDASEQFDAQSRNISQMSGREPNSLQPQPIQKHAGMARGYFDDQLDPQSRSMNNFTSRDSNNLQQLTQKHSGMARLNDVPYEEEEDVPLESMMEPPPHDRAHIAFANLPSFQPQFTLQDSQPEHTVSPTKREKSRNSRPKEQQQYIPQDPSPFSTPFAFNTTPNQPAVFSSRQEEDLKPSLSNWVEEQRKIRPKKPPAPLLSQISLVSSPMDETEDREVFNVPPPPSHPPRFARQVSGGMVAPHLCARLHRNGSRLTRVF
ncbi:hypothetical protein BC829DRAFT_197018 [Chytridium lagenaria]|nr:hypothetical protein BC829DRAFT_197018 [Chytridium lagenaria]